MSEIDSCPDCGRMKARDATDASYGACSKWYAIRDEEAYKECEDILQATNTYKQLEVAKQRELDLLATIKDLRESLQYVHPYFIPGRDCSDRMTQVAEELIEEALHHSEHINGSALEKVVLEARINEMVYVVPENRNSARLHELKVKLSELNRNTK